MLHTYNMKITRRSGFFLSLLLVPALVLNPAPAQALVYPAGSVDTSWGNSGYTKFGNDLHPAQSGYIASDDGGILFPVSIDEGAETGIGIQAINALGQPGGLFAKLPAPTGYSYHSATNLDFDIASNSWVLFFETSKGLAVAKFSTSGILDTSFGQGGITFPSEMVTNAIGAIEPVVISGNEFNVELGISFNDMEVARDGSIFLIGDIMTYANNLPLNGHPLNSDLVLWKIDADGNLATNLSSDVDEGKKFVANTYWPPGKAGTYSNRLVINPSKTKLTVVSTVSNTSTDLGVNEIFLQRFDVSDSNVANINVLGQPFFVTNLQWNSSFMIFDGVETSNNEIFLVGDEYGISSRYGVVFRFNVDSGSFTSRSNVETCSHTRVTLDDDDRILVSGSCAPAGTDIPSLVRFKGNGAIDTEFDFAQSQWGDGPFYDPRGIVATGGRVLVIGWAGDRTDNPCGSSVEISGCSLSFYSPDSNSRKSYEASVAGTPQVYASAYRSSAHTVDDEPTPGPAPVVAPALPTQTAPVAVPAVMKVKKKLKFPITSQAGNPLKVTATGACKASPVFKKVKVKVGKKTKKIKKQTGWTVQMKKKNKTCTITQSDAGGNGYAALSSTVTVTIK